MILVRHNPKAPDRRAAGILLFLHRRVSTVAKAAANLKSDGSLEDKDNGGREINGSTKRGRNRGGIDDDLRLRSNGAHAQLTERAVGNVKPCTHCEVGLMKWHSFSC